VWGSGPNDVWAAGAGGIIHFDGATWTKSDAPTLGYGWINALSGSGPNDVWAVGGRYVGADVFSVTLHWNGEAWSEIPSGKETFLGGVWSSGPDDVWAVGSWGVILHHP
jgi:hypothetical protein